MRTLLTIVLFVFVLKASAQYDVPKKEYCDEFKSRTLAVELIA